MPKAPATADPSTRRLSEVARHVVVPAGIVDTLWFEVEEQCREWGDEFDVWQDGLGQLALGLRQDGTFAATVGGVTLSIPRQVAKTFIVGRIVFALAARHPNLTILWTAHRIRTATQTFEKLKALAKRPSVRPYMLDNAAGGIRSVNGEQEFQFANGSKIMFGAREQGFGRGFDEVDIEVFDEAQILTEKALEDMVAATNQSRFQYGALLFFMGTPPRPTDPGEEFRNRRLEALALKSSSDVVAIGEDSLYVECSADPKTGQPGGPSMDDLEQVARANPSYPHRTPLMSIRRLWKNLTSEGSKRREGLGIWDDDSAQLKPLIMPSWPERASLQEPEPAALAVAMDLDRVWLSLAASSGGDRPHLGSVLRVRADTQKSHLLAETARISKKFGIPVVLDPKDAAANLENDLEGLGVAVSRRNLVHLSFDDYVQACADLYDAIEAGEATHGDYDDLNDAVTAAGWRKAALRRVWAPISGDISMLKAASLAMWGAQHADERAAPSASYAF
jgi:hypothetical protein